MRQGPTYAGAKDVSCKMVSGDAIAKAGGMKEGEYWPEKSPKVTCRDVNKQSIQRAIQQLQKQWPESISRQTAQGRQISTMPDSSNFAGPQWVFLSELKFDEGKTNTDVSIPLKVTSPYIYSNIESKIWPGNYYCKFLSPAKAIEWIQTRGLTKRFS